MRVLFFSGVLSWDDYVLICLRGAKHVSRRKDGSSNFPGPASSQGTHSPAEQVPSDGEGQWGRESCRCWHIDEHRFQSPAPSSLMLFLLIFSLL